MAGARVPHQARPTPRRATPVRGPVEVAGREREADRIADGDQTAPVPATGLEARGPMPAVVSRAIRAPGRPLSDAPLLWLHDGPEAGRAARALGADAFTIGRHIVLPGERHPAGSSATARLLRHERAHAAQQAGAGQVRVDRKPAPAPPDPYKPLKDRIAEESRRRYGGLLGHLATLRKMQELADAIEASDVAATKRAVATFIARDDEHPLDPATAVLLRDVPMVLVTRTFLLGLVAEAHRLEAHFFRARSSAYDQPTRGEGHSTRYAVLRSVVEAVTAGAKFDNVAQAEAALNKALGVIAELNTEASRLDLKEIRRQRDEARREAMSMGGFDTLALHDDPGRSESAFYSGLLRSIGELMSVVQRGVQVLMDAAIGEVEAKSTTHTALSKVKTVVARVRAVAGGLHEIVHQRRARLKPGQPDPAFGLEGPLNVGVDITRSDFEHRPQRHLDYFDRSRRSPAVTISAYDTKEMSFSEKSLDIERTIEVREQQIAFLERLTGLATDKTGKVTAESQQNAAALATVKRFALHGNDGWRELLLTKFRAAHKETGDNWKALLATVSLLQGYLSAFTTHTPYNIDEFGEPYLSRTFPRAMTGQLIHDCGVYALRVAYMLSLVREELHLTFRAALMPVHIGLVISFGDDVTKGALYVNNNQILPIQGQPSNVPGHQNDPTLTDLAETWRTTDPQGRPRPPAALDAKAFHAEVMSALFVEGANVPVQLVDVPSGPASSTPAANKQKLWDWYHRVIRLTATRAVPGTSQPELKYLALLEMLRDMHNQIRVPAYRRAFDQFRRDADALKAAAAALKSPDARRRNEARATLQKHKAAIEKIFEPLMTARARAMTDAAEVNEFMRTNPGAVGATSRLRMAMRLNLSTDFEISRYLGTATSPGLLEQGQVVPDGWSDATRLPGRSD